MYLRVWILRFSVRNSRLDFPPYFSHVKGHMEVFAANILARMEVTARLQPSDVFVQMDGPEITVKFPQARTFDNKIDCRRRLFLHQFLFRLQQ